MHPCEPSTLALMGCPASTNAVPYVVASCPHSATVEPPALQCPYVEGTPFPDPTWAPAPVDQEMAPVLPLATPVSAFTTKLSSEDVPSPQYNPARVQGVRSSLPSPSDTPDSTHRHCDTPCCSPAARQAGPVLPTRPVAVRATTAPQKSVHGCVTARPVASLPARRVVENQGGPPPVAPEPMECETQFETSASVSATKDRFVNGLVGACVLAIESIWGPTSSGPPPTEGSVLPLHWFVKEVLRRSRTSCSTLQVALFYLHQARREIRSTIARASACKVEFITLDRALRVEQDRVAKLDYPSPPTSPIDSEDRYIELAETQNSPILCGRRMFLAAVISASKFLQDRNYSNRAWAKISGLPVGEVNLNERTFLKLVRYKLYVGSMEYQQWTVRLAAISTLEVIGVSSPPSPPPPVRARAATVSSSVNSRPIPTRKISTPSLPSPTSTIRNGIRMERTKTSLLLISTQSLTTQSPPGTFHFESNTVEEEKRFVRPMPNRNRTRGLSTPGVEGIISNEIPITTTHWGQNVHSIQLDCIS